LAPSSCVLARDAIPVRVSYKYFARALGRSRALRYIQVPAPRRLRNAPPNPTFALGSPPSRAPALRAKRMRASRGEVAPPSHSDTGYLVHALLANVSCRRDASSLTVPSCRWRGGRNLFAGGLWFRFPTSSPDRMVISCWLVTTSGECRSSAPQDDSPIARAT
jgi:hypothetical protein